MVNDAGLGDVGRKVRQRSHDAARLDGRRDHAAWIDALEPKALELAAITVEIPPRHAVLRADDGRVGAQQRCQLRRERRQTVSFHAEKNDIGRPDRREIAGHPRLHLEIAVRADDAQPALLHRAQMRTAREQNDIGTHLCQPRADIAANRAGAGDDDPHEMSRA